MEALGSSGQRFANRPKTLVCHICGREFGTKSLPIHIKACTKKWEDAEMLKPRRERRPVPRPPSDAPTGMTRAEMDQRNAAAMAAFETQAMKKCPNCGRTFLEDRLPIHLRSCTSENPHKAVNRPQNIPEETKSPQTSAITLQAKLPSAKPRTVEYSSHAQAPIAGEYAEIELRQCSRCGRNIAADRLAKHESVCGKSGKSRPVFQSAAKRAVDPLMMRRRPQSTEKSGSTGKWKKEHQDFINAMRYSKKVERAQKAGVDIRTIQPPPSTSDYSDYVNCPYCGRNYAPQTAEKHIPKCANIVNKPKPPPSRRLLDPNPVSASTTRLTTSPKPPAHSPKPMGKSPGPPRQQTSTGMARSSTEAVFRKVLKPCPSCKQMIPGDQLETHLQSCASPKPQSMKSTTLRAPTGGLGAKRISGSSAERIKPSTARHESIGESQGSTGLRQFCTMCGSRFTSEGKFCSACGTRR